MALRRLIQQNHNANFVGFGAGAAAGEPAVPMDSRRIQHLANTVGTLPRGRKQLALTRSSSLGDSSRPQRHLVAILKEDKETFGFEIQGAHENCSDGGMPDLLTCYRFFSHFPLAERSRGARRMLCGSRSPWVFVEQTLW